MNDGAIIGTIVCICVLTGIALWVWAEENGD